MKQDEGAPRALPERPDLDHLKHQARELQRAAQAGDMGALRRIEQHHPKRAKQKPDAPTFSLSDAQLVIAREHGFRSWPKLRTHVLRVLAEYRDEAPSEGDTGEAVSAQIRQRLRRLARIDGSVSARDLQRLQTPLDVAALLALAVPHCEASARPQLVQDADPAAVVAALDVVIGVRAPQPMGAGAPLPAGVGDADAGLSVLYCGGFPHLLGRRFPLDGRRVTLGRNLERDLSFDDDSVSRMHCSIERRDGRFVLRDEGSTNGTFVAISGAFVNQAPEPVTEHVLSDGDQLAIGDVILVFIAADEGAAQPEAQLEAKHREAIEYIATHDALTRLYNRRAFDAELGRAVLEARGVDRPLSTLLLDVDGFKSYNDRLGLLAGNGLLLRLAQVLRQELGEGQVIGRYAGDAYAVQLPGVDLEGALAVAERLRVAVAARPLELAGETIHVTTSAGVSTLYRTTGAEELMDDARAALRDAKGAGRNTVRAAA